MEEAAPVRDHPEAIAKIGRRIEGIALVTRSAAFLIEAGRRVGGIKGSCYFSAWRRG